MKKIITSLLVLLVNCNMAFAACEKCGETCSYRMQKKMLPCG